MPERLPDLDKLIKKSKRGDVKARNRIIEHYSYMINMVMKRLLHINFLDDGAKRYGALLGLLRAIQCYDFRGNFEMYAYTCMLRRAERELSSDYIVHIPNGILAKHLKDGTFPYGISRFDESQFENGSQRPLRTMHVETDVENRETNRLLSEQIDRLTPIERDAIRQKFGFSNETLKSLGKKYGVTCEWIRQIGDASLEQIKKRITRKIKNINELKTLKEP